MSVLLTPTEVPEGFGCWVWVGCSGTRCSHPSPCLHSPRGCEEGLRCHLCHPSPLKQAADSKYVKFLSCHPGKSHDTSASSWSSGWKAAVAAIMGEFYLHLSWRLVGAQQREEILRQQSCSPALGSQNLLPNLALPTWPQALRG